MTRIVLTLALALLSAAGLDAGEPPAAPSAEAPSPAAAPSGGDLAAAAASLPALPREAGAIRLPLSPASGPEPGWRSIRDGITLAHETGLDAAYRVATGQPAGASLLVPSGTFRPGDAIVVKASADRNVQLLVTLQDASGAAFSLPAIPLRPGNPRRHERTVADASYFAPQSSAPEPDSFDPNRVIMITLLDISGFMGSSTPEVHWTVESLRIEGAGAGEEESR